MAHFTLLRTDLIEAPSDWLCIHAQHIRPTGSVLDVAAGSGRNARWLAQQGFRVEAVDRDRQALESMFGVDNINLHLADIENTDWPYVVQQFDAIIVCRYLYRPLFPLLLQSLATHGVLIYETFMQGNEVYGKPSNPDFLLRENELLEVFQDELEVIVFEQGFHEKPKPAMLQRICAKKR
jgi:SAM-dependent methyltransferase